MGVAAHRPGAQEVHGRLAAGTLRVGDPIVHLPSGSTSTVTALDTLDDARGVAVGSLSVSLELADDIDVGRGDVFVSGAEGAALPVLARELDATVCWFTETPLRAGDRLALKQGARTVRATVQALHSRLDPETLDDLDGPVELVLNDIGAVTLWPLGGRGRRLLGHPRQRKLHSDRRDVQRHRQQGTITEAREVKPGAQARNDIRWHPSSLDRDYRWSKTGQRGATIWFTGLPASGKSTVVAVERALVESGHVAYLLDGDNLRHGLSDDLRIPAGDRAENIRRIGHLTRLLADAGVIALASLVSPLKSDRQIARALNEAAKLPFCRGVRVDVARRMREARSQGASARARSASWKSPGSTHRTNHRRTPIWCSTPPAPTSMRSSPR